MRGAVPNLPPLRDTTVSLPGIIGMNEVERLFDVFRARASSSAASKLDVLLDLELLHDPRIVPFMVQVLSDSREPEEVRIHLIKRLRNGHLSSDNQRSAAQAIIRVLADSSGPDLR